MEFKVGICGLHYHPSDPFLFVGFFSDPYSLFENFIFYHSSLCTFFSQSIRLHAVYMRKQPGIAYKRFGQTPLSVKHTMLSLGTLVIET